MILRPFVPFSTNDERTELQAYMTASSDPDTYGQLTALRRRQDRTADGPAARSPTRPSPKPTISPADLRCRTRRAARRCRFGDLQLVPVADGLLYVRPFYAVGRPSSDREHDAVTEYRYVDGARQRRGSSTASRSASALAKLFPGFSGDLGDRDRGSRTSTGPTPRTTGTSTHRPGDDRRLLTGRAAAAEAEAAVERRRPRRLPANVTRHSTRHQAKALVPPRPLVRRMALDRSSPPPTDAG